MLRRMTGWLVGSSTVVLALAPLVALGQTSPSDSPSDPVVSVPARWGPWQAATVIPVGPARFWDVTRWSRGFAAIGSTPGERVRRLYRSPIVWLSADGSRWVTSGPLSDSGFDRLRAGRTTEVWRLVHHGSGLLGIGTDEGRLAVWRSTDGRRWHRVRHQAAFEPAGVPAEEGYSLSIDSIVSGHGRVVVSGAYVAPGDTRSYSRTWVSSDGDAWRRDEPSLRYPAIMSQLVVVPEGFLAMTWARRHPAGCGGDDASRIVRSPDGIRWRDVPGSSPICRATSLTYDRHSKAYFVLTHAGESASLSILRSPDLKDWDEVYRGPTEIDGREVSMGGGVIRSAAGSIAVVGSGSSQVGDSWLNFPWSLTSGDGLSWTLSTGWPGNSADLDVEASAMDRDRIVAVDVYGDGGAWYSEARAGRPFDTPPGTGRPWGPLAVAADPAQHDLDAGLGPGRLQVGDDCVTLTVAETGVAVTLIWRDGQTSWDPAARRILFDDRDEGRIRLSDSDRMMLSGAPLMAPGHADQGAAQPTWVAPPHGSCPESRWVVHQVDPRDPRDETPERVFKPALLPALLDPFAPPAE